ncbi:MAG: ferredoxin [Clostridiaceae bacterium]|nr:ferredoxin [Clostridiaceae bacterium]
MIKDRKINKIWAVYFSPTKSTKKITEYVAKQLADIFQLDLCYFDFTLPEARKSNIRFSSNDLVVFGMPVYAGRIPNKMVDYVKSIKGEKTSIVTLVTYGNRSFQDSLIELKSIFETNNFDLIAAAAFVAEHAMTDVLAKARPLNYDYEVAKQFALDIFAKINSNQEKVSELNIPGNDFVGPYYVPLGLNGEPVNFLKAKPLTNDSCINCHQCIRHCPMGSIAEDDPKLIDGICIKCQSCIHICPVHAKYFDDQNLLSHIAYLEENFSQKEYKAEIFL